MDFIQAIENGSEILLDDDIKQMIESLDLELNNV